MKPAAFQATYSDWKLIRTRKCVQIVFEVPIESADEAYQVVGGMPNGGEEAWFAIARLEKGITQIKEKLEPNRLVQRAGILCTNHGFQNFLQSGWAHKWIDKVGSEDEKAAAVLRELCEIQSRKEFATSEKAAAIFETILGRYEGWRRGIE